MKSVEDNFLKTGLSAICFADLTNKNRSQAIVGTVDNEISVFDAEELIDSRTETSPIILLTEMNPTHIAYATENGTIGIYKGLDRLWRVKSKSVAACQTAYKVNLVTEGVLTGWMNGRWELRTGVNPERHQVVTYHELFTNELLFQAAFYW